MVVKKDGRREKFDRQKVLSGLLHATEKRPVPAVKLEQIVDETEAYVVDSPERERSTNEVGELIMSRTEGHRYGGLYTVCQCVSGLQRCSRVQG